MASPHILNAAATWYTAGTMPLPLRADGSKAPAVNWRTYQHQRPTWDQVAALFQADTDGLGVICGNVSGHLEMLEFEGPAVTDGLVAQVASACTDHGRQDLWQRVADSYKEVSPGGGLHLYYQITDGDTLPNTKLARRPATNDELAQNPSNKIRVLIETRGEGGFSVVAPSAGRSHPTGRAWTQISPGGVDTLAHLTADERDFLHDMCRLFDAMPQTDTYTPPATPTPPTDGRLRPGDDFNARANWDDIIGTHGWQRAWRGHGLYSTWLRPGKKHGERMSATTGRDEHDRLFVFSTSTEFEAEKPYDKFGAYALLEHNGDLAAATKALAEKGYGDPAPERRLTLLPSDPGYQRTAATTGPATDGATALAPIVQLQPATTVDDNEDALATAFVAQVADILRYCPQRSQWLHWTGARWEWDEAEIHRELVKDIARRLPATDKYERAWRRKMLTANGISAIARLARTDPRIVVHINQLDAQPWELNTPGGIINLRSGELLPPDPAKLHTRTTSCTPDFTLDAPHWTRFLDDTFGGDQELIDFVQRILGVAIIGQVLEQILPFAHGAGANGKSTLIEAVMQTLGRGQGGYSIAAAAEMLMVRRHSEHPAELAQLAGARMVVCSELEDGQRFAEARIKQLTGSDSINARHMYGNPFTFTPTHTIFLIANHKPMATVGGNALWRRIVLIPFEHVVPEHLRDPHLAAKLEAEAPAILAWLARGSACWYAGGLRIPAAVKAASEAYRKDEDTVGRFVAEQCHVPAGGGGGLVQVKVGELRRAYEQACIELGDDPVSARRFSQELRDRWGIEAVKAAKGARFYKGVALITVEDDPGDDQEPEDGGLL
ncbi:phage/plasmid primase, P4 family [Tessaracoccus palaemonis]|uniref:Bifunctional DNA primase/polymerase n=1 Tax=Tessaracoccus palaemonis TaxID=2829499 RepID=A0ABX8SHE3_9ACTN|nr:phage/plasmid primase, P4 family [Tessaracoccus palaemonis]QXT62741.1 bifunctional DNA primase/polymerase [Tessaracoccus palaemonis]